MRAAYAELMPRLEDADLAGLCERVTSCLAEREVTFGDGPGAPVFPLDPVPRVIGPEEWARISAGLEQRARAIAAFVADVYGDRRIVAAGVMPARAIESAEGFEVEMMGVPVSAGSIVMGFDLVRCSDGVLRVLEDNLRTPSGLAYASEARAALDRCLPCPAPSRLDPETAFEALAHSLAAAAPVTVEDPTIVLLTDGPRNNAWFEHREIARRLGLLLVERSDLTRRGSEVHARVDEHTRRVDVVYRRTDMDRLRDAAGRPTWLADVLLGAVRNRELAVVNPFGTGVADDKLVHAYVEKMIRYYLDEEPILESVPTLDLGDAEVRREALERLDELVFKPRHGLGGEGIVVCAHAAPEDRRRVAQQVAADPDSWIAQETVSISTHPTVCDGRLEARHVDLRPFSWGEWVAPAPLTRVALDDGALVVNSSQNGGAKDTWVLA